MAKLDIHVVAGLGSTYCVEHRLIVISSEKRGLIEGYLNIDARSIAVSARSVVHWVRIESRH